MKRRRIVPDNSVIVPAYFHETLARHGRPFPLSARCRPIIEAIRNQSVVAFAPDMLIQEFFKVSHLKATSRAGRDLLDSNEVEAQILEFQELPVAYVPALEIAAIAWDCISRAGLSPPDSWYLACAIFHDAELWISHEHKDGIVSACRKIHPKVFCLTERRF